MRRRTGDWQPGAIRAAGDTCAGEIAEPKLLAIRGSKFHEEQWRKPICPFRDGALQSGCLDFGHRIRIHVIEAAIVGEQEGPAVNRRFAGAFLFAFPKMECAIIYRREAQSSVLQSFLGVVRQVSGRPLRSLKAAAASAGRRHSSN